jgi:hypothetical protein
MSGGGWIATTCLHNNTPLLLPTNTHTHIFYVGKHMAAKNDRVLRRDFLFLRLIDARRRFSLQVPQLHTPPAEVVEPLSHAELCEYCDPTLRC